MAQKGLILGPHKRGNFYHQRDHFHKQDRHFLALRRGDPSEPLLLRPFFLDEEDCGKPDYRVIYHVTRCQWNYVNG